MRQILVDFVRFRSKKTVFYALAFLKQDGQLIR